MSKTIDTTIPKTILQQLGGAKFLFATGSSIAAVKSFSLSIELQPNQSKANRMKVSYNVGSDLYAVHFLHCYTRKDRAHFDVVETFQEVFFDQLQDLFEEVTGFYLTIVPRQN